MGRYTFPAFNKAPTPRYVVDWDLHWHVIESQRLELAADLAGAMAAAIDRLEGEGWQPETTPEYGFVFIQRDRSAITDAEAARSVQRDDAIF